MTYENANFGVDLRDACPRADWRDWRESVQMIHEPKFTSQPLYVQLREALMQRISSGDWRPGAALPNEIDIAREYGLSAGTVRKALDWMEQANLVIRQQGRGTFVRDQSTDELAHRFENVWDPKGDRLTPAFAEMIASLREADAYACESLKLKPGAKVHHISQLRTLEGLPFMFEVIVLPEDLFAKIPQSSYTVTSAASESGVLLGKAEERVFLAEASGEIATKLGVPQSTPILRLDRVVHTLDGRPAEWRVAWCLMGRNHYRASIGTV